MQFPFYTDYDAQYFSKNVSAAFPSAPERCPFKDFSKPVKLKKHGYYARFFISKSFTGVIYIVSGGTTTVMQNSLSFDIL